MTSQIELLRKLKALSERGIGGEAINARDLLQKLMIKHQITLEDLAQEEIKEYFFKASKIEEKLLHQIAKCVNFDIKMYSIPAKDVRYYRLGGNAMIQCTPAEFIEIDQMFAVYKNLYKSEVEVFFHAFLQANDLLPTPPDAKTLSDLTLSEREELIRVAAISTSIKKEHVRKQIETSK